MRFECGKCDNIFDVSGIKESVVTCSKCGSKNSIRESSEPDDWDDWDEYPYGGTEYNAATDEDEDEDEDEDDVDKRLIGKTLTLSLKSGRLVLKVTAKKGDEVEGTILSFTPDKYGSRDKSQDVEDYRVGKNVRIADVGRFNYQFESTNSDRFRNRAVEAVEIEDTAKSDTIELLDNPMTKEKLEAEIRASWPDGITYNGKELIDLYIDKWAPRFARRFGDSQECYLGYNIGTDSFFMGFDVFTAGRKGGAAAYVEFSVSPTGAIKVKNEMSTKAGGMFYKAGGYYDRLKKSHGSLIDLRLD